MIKPLSICSVVLFAACSAPTESPKNTETIHQTTETLHPLAAMIGCWESADGLAREVWSKDPSGWLFGHAVNRGDNNTVKFFEQMWIETHEGKPRFNVSARGGDVVQFASGESIKGGIGFENPDHDFPQRIVYLPSPGRLDAYISAIDGSQRIEFRKQACR